MPIGIAGPLLVNGEHAQGEFYVPMATTEGTLVASCNHGMKIMKLCGGVMTTIQDEAMQRAPVFIFENARQARDFGIWLTENFEEIKKQAESTTMVGKLKKDVLRKEGYDIGVIKDPVYVLLPGESGYVPLTAEIKDKIDNGLYRY